MKLIKGTALVIMFCFAAYGAFVLLKPPAKLHLSNDERESIKEELGFEIHSTESENGRSAILNNVTGAPPLKRTGSSVSASKVPDSLSGVSSQAPDFAPATDEAPAFGAPATPAPPFDDSKNSEAPPFGDPTMTAPPFAASKNSEAPAFVASSPQLPPPPKAAMVEPSPVYGNQVTAPNPSPKPTETPQQPAPAPAAPAAETPVPPPTLAPESLSAAPIAEAAPAATEQDPASLALALAQSLGPQTPSQTPPSTTVAAASVQQPVPVPPVSVPPVSVPPIPIEPVPVQPTSEPVKSPEIQQQPMQTGPSQTEPAVSSTVASNFSSTSSPSTSNFWDGPQTDVAVKQLSAAPQPTEQPNNSPNSTQVSSPEKKSTVAFVVPQIRRLPKVEEEPAIHPLAVQSQPQQQRNETTTPDGFAIPHYQQASIRHTGPQPTPDAAPVVSFSAIQQHPDNRVADVKPGNPLAANGPKNEPVKPESVPLAVIASPVVAPAAEMPAVVLELPKVASIQTAPAPETAEPQKALFIAPTTASTGVPAKPSPLPPSTSAPFEVENPITPQPKVQYAIALPMPPTEPRTEIREQVSRFIQAQCELIGSGDSVKIRTAFVQLSRLYDHPELNEFERAILTPILDRLAVDVVFARKNHILEDPFIVRNGEASYTFRSGETIVVPVGNSIDSIAASFNLTPELLMKINGLTNKRPLEPGTPIKVVLGHFDAKVSTERREFVLILGGLYAGRFPISVGEDIQNVRGDFSVTLKRETPQGRLLTLSNGITLRGIDKPQPGDSLRSSFRFSERDAVELFDIMSEKSVVAIGK